MEIKCSVKNKPEWEVLTNYETVIITQADIEALAVSKCAKQFCDDGREIKFDEVKSINMEY